MNSLTKPLLLLGSLTLAAALTGCVDPYVHNQGPPSHTAYRAGYEVRSLPHGYRTEEIEGNRYYSHNGTYYRSQSGRYVVVEAPRQQHYRSPSRHRDVVITSLPRGYRTVERGGVRYYQSNGVYYQRRGPGYVVIDRPY